MFLEGQSEIFMALREGGSITDAKDTRQDNSSLGMYERLYRDYRHGSHREVGRNKTPDNDGSRSTLACYNGHTETAMALIQ
jgi:hypothetical protein